MDESPSRINEGAMVLHVMLTRSSDGSFDRHQTNPLNSSHRAFALTGDGREVQNYLLLLETCPSSGYGQSNLPPPLMTSPCVASQWVFDGKRAKPVFGALQ